MLLETTRVRAKSFLTILLDRYGLVAIPLSDLAEKRQDLEYIREQMNLLAIDLVDLRRQAQEHAPLVINAGNTALVLDTELHYQSVAGPLGFALMRREDYRRIVERVKQANEEFVLTRAEYIRLIRRTRELRDDQTPIMPSASDTDVESSLVLRRAMGR